MFLPVWIYFDLFSVMKHPAIVSIVRSYQLKRYVLNLDCFADNWRLPGNRTAVHRRRPQLAAEHTGVQRAVDCDSADVRRGQRQQAYLRDSDLAVHPGQSGDLGQHLWNAGGHHGRSVLQ